MNFSASSSSGASSMVTFFSFPECTCGIRVEMKTSRTRLNLGRQFLRCSNKEKQCGFFEWVDPEINPRNQDDEAAKLNFWIGECYRLQKYMEEIMKRIRLLEDELRLLKMEKDKSNKFLKKNMLICACVVGVVYVVMQSFVA